MNILPALGPIAAALVVCLVGGANAADGPSCKMVKQGELPLKFEQNRPLVSVTINGKPAWFLIDTGAFASNVFSGPARAFGLTETSVDRLTVYGVGGIQNAKQVIVSELGLGGAKVKDVRMLSLTFGGSADMAGLLGRDFLGRLGDIEFDLAAGVVRFWKADQCQHRSLAYWSTAPAMAELDHSADNAPYFVKVRLNGKPVDAELDSGAGTTIVTPGIARQAGVPPEKYESEIRNVRGIGDGKVSAQIAKFNLVAVGQEEIKHTRLQVSDLFQLDTREHTGSKLATREYIRDQPDMLLGADFLRSHRVLIAASQGLLYFTYSGGPIFEVVGDAVKSADPLPAPTK